MRFLGKTNNASVTFAQDILNTRFAETAALGGLSVQSQGLGGNSTEAITSAASRRVAIMDSTTSSLSRLQTKAIPELQGELAHFSNQQSNELYSLK